MTSPIIPDDIENIYTSKLAELGKHDSILVYKPPKRLSTVAVDAAALALFKIDVEAEHISDQSQQLMLSGRKGQ